MDSPIGSPIGSPISPPVPASLAGQPSQQTVQGAGGNRTAAALPYQFGHMPFGSSTRPAAHSAQAGHFPTLWQGAPPAPLHVGTGAGGSPQPDAGNGMHDVLPVHHDDDAFDMDEHEDDHAVSALGSSHGRRGSRYGSMSGPAGGSGAPSHGRVAAAIGTTSGSRHSDDSYHHADGPGFGFDFGLGDEEEEGGEQDGQGDVKVV